MMYKNDKKKQTLQFFLLYYKKSISAKDETDPWSWFFQSNLKIKVSSNGALCLVQLTL